MKTSLITGVTGQIASYLAELLLSKEYAVVGVKRRTSTNGLINLKGIISDSRFSLVEGDLTDSHSIQTILNKVKPDEVYNFAAMSHVQSSFAQPSLTFQVNTLGVLNILEWLRQSPRTKFWQASSSEQFGNNVSYANPYAGLHHCVVDDLPGVVVNYFQNEDTPFFPCSPYASAKLAAHNLVRVYRDSYKLYACCGIMFNTESERRGEEFVTRKITKWIGEFKRWIHKHKADWEWLVFDKDEIYIAGRINRDQDFQFSKLRLGNLNAKRDWGHAADKVVAIHAMLQRESPQDLVLATGETYSVTDFLRIAFSEAGVPEKYHNSLYVIDPSLYRPCEVEYLKGDPRKAKQVLGWTPKVPFRELVRRMVQHDA